MWQREQLIAGWLPRAPRWTAAYCFAASWSRTWRILPGLLRSASDSGSAERPLPAAATSQSPSTSQHIVAAHLFGARRQRLMRAGRDECARNTACLRSQRHHCHQESQDGLAILGEQGKPAHLYRVGATVEMHQRPDYSACSWIASCWISTDGWRPSLPRSALAWMASKHGRSKRDRRGSAARPWRRCRGDERSGARLRPLSAPCSPSRTTSTAGWSAWCCIQPSGSSVNTAFATATCSPRSMASKSAIPMSWQNVLTSSSEKSLSLTFTRDGVEQTKTLPISN